jgi:carboxypeptidase Taq
LRPDLPSDLARGDFTALRGWLGEAVHARGSLLETDALLVAATGKPLGAEDFMAHLRLRYLGEG